MNKKTPKHNRITCVGGPLDGHSVPHYKPQKDGARFSFRTLHGDKLKHTYKLEHNRWVYDKVIEAVDEV